MIRRRHVTLVDGLRFATSIAGVPLMWPLGVGHLLIAGRTGSGKSTLLRSLLWSAASRSDVLLLAIDLKRAELTPWLPRLEYLATNRQSAVRALETVRRIIDARLERLTDHGVVEWSTQLGPWLLLVIDELAELLAGPRSAKSDVEEAEALLDSISRLGRAVGVHLVGATQRPSVEVLGGSLRDQLAYRFGLAVSDRGTSALVTQGATVDLTTVSDLGAGWGYYLQPGHPPILGRGDHRPVEAVPAWAALHANHRCIPVLEGVPT